MEWHQVALFGARAEALSKLLAKGARVLVEGGLQTSSYEKYGSKRYRTEIVASDLFLTGSSRATAGDPALALALERAARAGRRAILSEAASRAAARLSASPNGARAREAYIVAACCT